jgi:hypothetical protein
MAQNKDIQKCNFHYKTVRRLAMFLASALKRGIHPPWNITFSICFQGGDCLSLGQWRTEKIPYAKLT